MPAPLQAGQRRLQRRPGRVPGPRVVVPAAGLADDVLGIGGGLVDRHDDRTGQRVGLLAGMDGAGGRSRSSRGQSHRRSGASLHPSRAQALQCRPSHPGPEDRAGFRRADDAGRLRSAGRLPIQRPVAGSRASTTTTTPPQNSGHCSTGILRRRSPAVADARTARRRWWRREQRRRMTTEPAAAPEQQQQRADHHEAPWRPSTRRSARPYRPPAMPGGVASCGARVVRGAAVDALLDHRVGLAAEHPGGDQGDGGGQDRRHRRAEVVLLGDSYGAGR